MAEVTIRNMAEADLGAYKRLRDTLLDAHPEAFTSDAETERRRDLSSYRSRLTQGDGGATLFTLLAVADSRLVGALTCEREPRVKVRHVAHLIGMMVEAPWQGRGIGRRLLQAALQRLMQDPGLALVTLSVTAGNAAATGLYTACGFETYGRLNGAIRLADGRELDKLLMVRRLRN